MDDYVSLNLSKQVMKKIGITTASLVVMAGTYIGSHATYRHFKPEEKHTQVVQLLQVKRNDAGHPTWVLARENRELFVMEFDNDIPQVGQGIKFRDIIYTDHGPYRHLVKILFY